MSAIIDVENLSFGYTGSKPVIKDLCLEVKPNEIIAVAGPNGSGKTTLLNLICALLKPDTGSIKINSSPVESYSVRKLARQIALVRQESIPVFNFTAAQVVSMARICHLPPLGFETKTDMEIVSNAMETTDTAEFAHRPLAQLSAGERQRVFIARALAQQTPILLLDEPTNFLDFRHQVQIFDLLKKMQLEKAKTIIVITHDINLASQYCDRVLLLAQDTAYHTGKTGEVFCQGNIEKIFGVKTFTAAAGGEKFFMPVGKFSKDRLR